MFDKKTRYVSKSPCNHVHIIGLSIRFRLWWTQPWSVCHPCSSAAPQGQDSSSNPHLALLCSLQDDYRYWGFLCYCVLYVSYQSILWHKIYKINHSNYVTIPHFVHIMWQKFQMHFWNVVGNVNAYCVRVNIPIHKHKKNAGFSCQSFWNTVEYNHVQQHKSQQLEQLALLSEPTGIFFSFCIPIGTVRTVTVLMF